MNDAPLWLQVIAALAFFFPVLPYALLLPWHFIARGRGLIARSDLPTTLVLDGNTLVATHHKKTVRIALEQVTRARDARNDNWGESKMLVDALTLYGGRRRLLRVPLDSNGIDALISTLQRRGVPIEYVLISAPTLLD